MRPSPFLGALVLACVACGRPSGPSSRPPVAVSIAPHAWFVRTISGGNIPTFVLVPPNRDHHAYEPTPRQMLDLGRAAAWIVSGLEFERGFLPKVRALYPELRIVDPNRGVVFRRGEHHDGHGDRHAGPDPHTWLGLSEARTIASNILALLVDLDPANAEVYRRNHASLDAEILRTYQALRAELAPVRGRKIFVYHPAFGYFFDTFGLVQRPIETEGKEPGTRQLLRLIEEAKAERAAAVFVQKGYSRKAARTVAEAVGAEVVELDPMAEDWLDNIRRMAATLRRAVERSAP